MITSLHAEAEAIRQAELERSTRHLGELDADQQQAIDDLTRRIVAKLLYRPTVAVKDDAGTPKGDRLADSLRDLFGL